MAGSKYSTAKHPDDRGAPERQPPSVSPRRISGIVAEADAFLELM